MLLFLSHVAYETIPIPIESFQGLELGLCSPSLVGPTSPYEMDVDIGEIGADSLLDSIQTMDENQTAWYDTDL